MKSSLKLLVAWLALIAIADAHAMRWYSANTGRWFSRDPIGENGGDNLYAAAGNNVVSGIDALGLERFRIWASAYIPEATFRFPYPDNFDRSARWYGDDRRGAKVGGSSRAYHLVTIETDPRQEPVIRNSSGGGITKVDYFPFNWGPITVPSIGDFHKPFTDVDLDAAPPIATITRSNNRHTTTVAFAADTSDPLVRVAPSLHYSYTLIFDVCRGRLTLNGAHKKFPAYDLVVNGTAHVDYVPSGVYGSPFGPIGLGIPFTDPVGPITVPIQKYP